MLRLGLIMMGAALLVGSSAAREAAHETWTLADVVGLYHCEGTDAAGNPYTGMVRIVERGNTVLVQWSFGSQLAGVGFGVLNGDSLAVSYLGPSPGVALYRHEGNRLVGTWTEPGAGGAVFSETLTPVDDAEADIEPGVAPPRSETPAERPSRRRIHPGLAA